ncbi:MAG: hypothetical protein JOZ54_05765 [Acidobacteria bacterium]|nr:hypothetical protein [Acidobacteriota bacterium]
MQISSIAKRFFAAAAVSAALAAGALAQVTPAAGVTPPDDTPKFNIGAVIFADFTYQQSPEITDAGGNRVNTSSFNASRAYINVTGNLNHRISFRITPDVSRETGTGPSLSGSQIYRLKYAFGQYSLDDWTASSKGNWVRVGLQQTPFIDYTEGIYRYRFQGTVFPERTGLIGSSDSGVSGHYTFAGNYGDVHAGFYNGENYSRAETNDQKAFQARVSVRPFPLGGVFLKGLRVSGFVVDDHYVKDAKRQRTYGQITYEHPVINAGFDVVKATDQTLRTAPEVESKGWSVWATPKFGTTGWEALLRHDEFTPNDNLSSQKQKRDIEGIAYWFQNITRVNTALLFDRDSLKRTGVTPTPPKTTLYGIKLLITF